MHLRDILVPLNLLSTHSRAPSNNHVAVHQTRDGLARRTDEGPAYGNVRIINSCDYEVFVRSVGAWPVDKNQDEKEFSIPAKGGIYSEPFRETCPKPTAHNTMFPTPTCPTLNKMEGQAISIKIAKTKVGTGPESIFQLEYALVQNPERGDKFKRLDYDVSLLNCEQIEDKTEAQVAADAALNQKKINGCPGYQGGLALWLDNHKICRPIFCDGVNYCDAIYNYQRTGKGEDSFACDQEYKGDLHLELCVNKGDGNAKKKYDEWAATGTKIPGGVPSATSAPPASSAAPPAPSSAPPAPSSAPPAIASTTPAPTPSKPPGELTTSCPTCDQTVTTTTTTRSTIDIPEEQTSAPAVASSASDATDSTVTETTTSTSTIAIAGTGNVGTGNVGRSGVSTGKRGFHWPKPTGTPATTPTNTPPARVRRRRYRHHRHYRH